jgi:phosphotransferase system  glucose/maltose/N-acetylglucosamine-specific IIC component
MVDAIAPIFAIVFTFGVPGILIFWYLYIKHKERTKLMDMGLSPQEARDYFREQERKPKNPLGSLKWGILFTMIGIGLFIGILLDEAGFKDELTGVMVLVFGGLGFIIYYFVASTKLKKEHQAPANNQANQ